MTCAYFNGIDLKPRGLLNETLVIWGGEFGRTISARGGLSHENHGRDHHPRRFTMWMAGGSSRPGISSMGKPTTSRTIIVMDPDHIHDFDATVSHLQGFDRRLTGVEPARIIKDLLV